MIKEWNGNTVNTSNRPTRMRSQHASSHFYRLALQCEGDATAERGVPDVKV